MRTLKNPAPVDPHVHFAAHLSPTSHQHLLQARVNRLSTAVASRLRLEAEIRALVNLIKLQGPHEGISAGIQDRLVALQAAKAEEEQARRAASSSTSSIPPLRSPSPILSSSPHSSTHPTPPSPLHHSFPSSLSTYSLFSPRTPHPPSSLPPPPAPLSHSPIITSHPVVPGHSILRNLGTVRATASDRTSGRDLTPYQRRATTEQQGARVVERLRREGARMGADAVVEVEVGTWRDGTMAMRGTAVILS